MTTVEPTGKTANPYVGPRAFQPGETLYGRDRETFELLNLVIAERIVLLYSPSGAGKTSLLNAGLIPSLKAEGFGVLPIVRIGLDPGRGPTIRHRNRYLASTLVSLEQDAPGGQRLTTDQGDLRLEAYLDRRGPADDRDDQVFIVDALEELLTLDPTDRPAKERFMAEVGEVLRDLRRWAVFAVREDYLGALEPFVRHIPTRLARSFRLNLLEAPAARAAIQRPAQAAGVDFTDAAAQRLVDNLRRVQVQRPDGRSQEVGPYVEPVQLQVVCRRLWERLPEGAARIGTADVDAVADIDRALAGYYAEQVAAIAGETQMPEQAIRDWVERQLITEQGFRAQVLQGPDGAAEREVLRLLEDVHLVRAEQRRGAAWFELAHDRLIEPVRADNAAWRERNLTPLQRQAEHWDEQHRSEGLLLRGDALAETEDRLRRDPVELSPTERDFLDACRALARREAETARRQRRLRWLTVGLAALLVLTLLSTILAVQQRNQARAASAKATSMAQLAAARQLITIGGDELDGRLDRSLLLSLESLRLQDTPEARANLLAGLQRSPISTAFLNGHGGAVDDVAFAPDGRTLASASADGTVRLWDVARRAPLTVLQGHRGRVTAVAFAPDGRTLASASADSTVRLWDVARRTEVAVLRGRGDPVNSVAFAPDGRTLASGSLDGTVVLWNVAGGTRRGLLPARDPVNGVALSRDGALLASATENGIWLWDTQRRVALGRLGDPDGPSSAEMVNGIAFSPDDRTLASAGADRSIRLWDVAGRSQTGVLDGHTDQVISVAFDHSDPSGSTLGSSSLDGTVRVWDTRQRRPRIVLRDQTSGVQAVAFSPDGRSLAWGARDATIRLGQLDQPNPLAVRVAELTLSVSGMASLLGGRVLAVGLLGGSVVLLDAERGTRLGSLPGGPIQTAAVASTRDGRMLAAGLLDGSVVLFDAGRRTRLRAIPGDQGVVGALSFSPNGRILAAGTAKGSVVLVDPESGSLREVLPGRRGPVTSLAFSPDGRLLVAGTEAGRVLRFDTAQWTTLPPLFSGPDRAVADVAFNNDGLLAVADNHQRAGNSTLTLWDPIRRVSLQALPHRAFVYTIAFSPDGDTLAAGADGEVALWDVPARARLGVVRGGIGTVARIAFGQGGHVIVVGGADGSIVLLNVQLSTWQRLGCATANRNLTAAEWRQYFGPQPYRRTCPGLPFG